MITQYAKNIANLTGADITDKLFINDLTKFLCEIKEPETFRQYTIKELSNSERLRFKNAYEKLYKLIEDYRQIEFQANNAGRLECAKSEAEKLADKVITIAPELMYHPELNYADFKRLNGESYFTSFEQKILSSIGHLARVCTYNKDELIDRIYTWNEKIIRLSNRKLLEVQK